MSKFSAVLFTEFLVEHSFLVVKLFYENKWKAFTVIPEFRRIKNLRQVDQDLRKYPDHDYEVGKLGFQPGRGSKPVT